MWIPLLLNCIIRNDNFFPLEYYCLEAIAYKIAQLTLMLVMLITLELFFLET